MIVLKAKETLLGSSDGVVISKGKEYPVVKSYLGNCTVISNNGQQITFSVDEVKYKFEILNKN